MDIGIVDKELTKICLKCKELKPLLEFCKNKASKDGINGTCKACSKKHREENKEKEAARCKRYREKNKEKEAARRKRYYKENKEKEAANNKRYRETDSGKIAEHTSRVRRRLRLFEASSILERINPEEILKRDGYRCQLCGKKTKAKYKDNKYHALRSNIDHIVPLALGGEHTAKNLQCLCARCNLEKGYTGKGDQLLLFSIYENNQRNI